MRAFLIQMRSSAICSSVPSTTAPSTRGTDRLDALRFRISGPRAVKVDPAFSVGSSTCPAVLPNPRPGMDSRNMLTCDHGSKEFGVPQQVQITDVVGAYMLVSRHAHA